MKDRTKTIMRRAVIALALSAAAVPALANHAWSTYHWIKGSGELTVPVGDNVNSVWDSALVTAVSDWNQSTVIQSPLVAGSTTPKQCRGVAGTIQVCNASYGRTGWLGIASISLSGGHISQGTTKLNDTYFNSAPYNTPAWRALVTCQEVGHDYGLGHQDEDFNNANLNTCMDYTNNPASNQHPNAHDYEQLLAIYNHQELAASVNPAAASSGVEVGDTPGEWGRAVHLDGQGRPDVFERAEAGGGKTITRVFWAIGEGPRVNRF